MVARERAAVQHLRSRLSHTHGSQPTDGGSRRYHGGFDWVKLGQRHGVGGNRSRRSSGWAHRQIRQANAAHLVAIPIDRRNEMGVGFALNPRQGRRDPARGLRAEIETDHPRRVRRKADPRDCREYALRLFGRHRGAIGKTRVLARRGILLSSFPLVHSHQRGAQQRVVIDRIERPAGRERRRPDWCRSAAMCRRNAALRRSGKGAKRQRATRPRVPSVSVWISPASSRQYSVDELVKPVALTGVDERLHRLAVGGEPSREDPAVPLAHHDATAIAHS